MPPDRTPLLMGAPNPVDITQAIADAAALGVSLEPEQASRLLTHVALLRRWNATYNLTAIRDPAAMWRQHVLDCLAAVPALSRRLAGQGLSRARLLDVGSGGALPGGVWAVALPELDVTCLDAVGKKVAFIRQVAGQLQLGRLHGVHARVEQWRGGPFDLVTSRAFASLRDFTDWTRHLLAPDGVWVAMKGKPAQDELRAVAPDVEVFHVEPLTGPGLDGDRCVVWMRPRPAP